MAKKVTAPKVEYKLATPPVKAKPITSIVGVALEANGHYAAPPMHKKKTPLVDDGPVKTDRKATPAEVIEAVIADKKADVLTPVKEVLEAAGFKEAMQETGSDGEAAVGYKHSHDMRAALLIVKAGKMIGWTLRFKEDTLDGTTLAQLRKAVEQTTTTIAEQIVAENAAKEKKKPTADIGIPANIVRAVEMLGGHTKQTWNIKMLRGDKYYPVRLKLMKTLTGAAKVLVKDTLINKVEEAFCKAVGATSKQSGGLVVRCKAIVAASRSAKLAVKKAEQKTIEAELKRTAVERAVPGKILPTVKRLGKKGRAKKEAKELAALKQELGPNPSKIAPLPPVLDQKLKPKHADATAPLAQHGPDKAYELMQANAEHFVPAECALIEHVDTGVVMLRLRKPRLDGGAPCVYNNGSTVSIGLVTLETLAKFREIEKADIPLAARQLLMPIVPTVKITTVAESHLTAVMNCKELITMAESTKKFAAPKNVPAKNAKTTKAKTAKTAKSESGPRKSSLFRLRKDTEKVWAAFTGQKGEIIAAFKKLGAVGAKATGATRAMLCEALPKISTNNISFYLSKWQEPKIVEKLEAAE